MTRNVTGAWPTLLCLGLAFGLASAGCKKSESTGGDVPGGPVMMPGGANLSPQEVLAKLPGGDEFAAGKKVYADNNCARCHKLGETGGAAMGGMSGPPGGPPGGPGMGGPPGGPGGPGMGGRPGMGGPDLTKTGAAADHTKDWLAAHVRDPKTHRQRSSMPPSGPDKISDADLDKLAAYLASQK